MAETEFEIGGETYRVNKLTPFAALDVARLLGPRLICLRDGSGVIAGKAGAALAALMGTLSQDDTDAVTRICLGAVLRKQGTAWAKISSPDGSLMFQDISLEAMMDLIVAVAREAKLDTFFFVADPPSSEAPPQPVTTP